MPETPNSPQPAKTEQPASSQQPTSGRIPMAEEFDSAKWTLPPLVPILIAVAAVAIVVAVVAFSNRATPVVNGDIVKVVSADQQGNTMVAVQVRMENKIPKQLWIKDIRSELETADGKKYPDHASPAADVERYLRAFPELQAARAETLREELKIPVGGSFTGTTVFSYPVSKEAFDKRKALTVRIQMYDQPTLVLTESPKSP
jgi:hypothetical protein